MLDKDGEISLERLHPDSRDYEANPLLQDFAFSFMTKSENAVLFFSYDNMQNLIYIFLKDPKTIKVIFNDKEKLNQLDVPLTTSKNYFELYITKRMMHQTFISFYMYFTEIFTNYNVETIINYEVRITFMKFSLKSF